MGRPGSIVASSTGCGRVIGSVMNLLAKRERTRSGDRAAWLGLDGRRLRPARPALAEVGQLGGLFRHHPGRLAQLLVRLAERVGELLDVGDLLGIYQQAERHAPLVAENRDEQPEVV